MPLHANNQLLISHLQSLAELDGRFTGMTLVNYDSVRDKREGVLSLVFRAFDKVERKQVALKFFDLDPRFLFDQYRLDCFARESSLLGSLVGIERCVQLVKPLTIYSLPVPIAGSGGASVTLGCQYFGLEWLDEKIDQYFLEQHKHDPLEKLVLFKDIILGVEALHRKGIFHRDLKADNFRAYSVNGVRRVVAIDLGTAARTSSSRLPTATYPVGPVGAPAFGSPESWCGLASSRLLGPFSDIYALGCLLFQLFHFDLYAKAVRQVNPDFDVRLAAMASMIPTSGDDFVRVEAWKRGVAAFGIGVNPVSIDAVGSSAPGGLVPILQGLLSVMTHIDYRQRPSLVVARSKIQSAIITLRNEHLYQRKLIARRERRRQKIAKLEQKQLRLSKLIASETRKC